MLIVFFKIYGFIKIMTKNENIKSNTLKGRVNGCGLLPYKDKNFFMRVKFLRNLKMWHTPYSYSWILNYRYLIVKI